MRSEDLRTNLTLGDKSFTTCFNQLQFNFFFFIGVVVIYILHIILVSKFSTGIWAAIDIACIAAQMVFIQKFVRLLIDLEMDFNLVVPGKIFFVNQQGLYSDIQTLEADKIKTIKSSYPSFFASFFHYGTIEVLTEGDESNIGHTTTEFVDRPEETVVNINSLLSGRYTLTEQIHSAYLQKVLSGFPGLPPEERKAKIKEYLTTYESQIKKEYLESQDTEMKERVEQLYREHYTK